MEDNFPPDLFISVGPRSILSLFGIVNIIWSQCWADGKWDNDGAEAYIKLVEAGTIIDDPKKEIEVPVQAIQRTYPRPYTLFLGWIFLGISFLLSNGGSRLHISLPGVLAMICCFYLGYAHFAVRPIMMARDLAKGRVLLISMTVASSALAVTSAFANRDAPLWICPLGVISLWASAGIYWQKRKMGENWILWGKPNPHPLVSHMGGAFLVIGWYLLWVGTEAESMEQENTHPRGIPIYFSDRSIIAHVSVFLIACTTCMADYAHDEGPMEDEHQVAFGWSGFFFFKVPEIWILFTFCWMLFGLSSFPELFLPGKSWLRRVLDVAVFVTCVLIGRGTSILYINGIRAGDYNRWWRSTVVILVLFGVLIVLSSCMSWTALTLSVLGTSALIKGQYQVLHDRKRGFGWMEMRIVHSDPNVYSEGHILHMVGLLMWALAMSIIH